MRKVVIPNATLIPEVIGLVKTGESVVLKTKGNSMLPFIHGGEDSVILTRPDDLRVMDIVLAEVSEGVYVLHRIVSVKGDQVVLMGDGNVKGVETCSLKNVYAMVSAVIRKNKTISCKTRIHRIKARIWHWLLPLRGYLLTIYIKIK